MSYRILSIDGGGVRGLIPGVVLLELEKRLGKSISDCFDLISGTSAGGQIALALSRATKDGTAFWSAEALDEFFSRSFSTIFPDKKEQKISLLRGITRKKYEADGMERVLEELFGDSLISESRVEVLVPAYEVENGAPHFFTRFAAQKDINQDYTMRFIARCTSSAPTFFSPHQHPSMEKAYIDGGVFANNPAMCAFAHAQSLGFDEDDMTIVSLGTGSLSKHFTYEESKAWGMIHWARPLFDITAQASNLSIDWQLSHILRKSHYFRITPIFHDVRRALDDARPANLEEMRSIGQKLIGENSDVLDQICEKISR